MEKDINFKNFENGESLPFPEIDYVAFYRVPIGKVDLKKSLIDNDFYFVIYSSGAYNVSSGSYIKKSPQEFSFILLPNF